MLFRTALFCVVILYLTESRATAQTTATSNPLTGLSNLIDILSNIGNNNGAGTGAPNGNQILNLLNNLLGNGNPTPDPNDNPFSVILNNLAGLNTISDRLNINDVTTLLDNLNNLANGVGDNGFDTVALQGILTSLLGNNNVLGNLSNNAVLQDVVNGLLSALQGNTNTGNMSGVGNGTSTQALIQGIVTSLLGGADPTAVLGGLLGLDDATISGLQQLLAGAQTGNVQEMLEELMPYAQLYIEQNVLPSLGLDGVNQQCWRDLSIMFQGVVGQQQWALRMLDAFAKPGTEILNGDIRWIGSFDECVAVTAVTYSNDTLKSDPVEQFTGKYCRILVPIGTIDFMTYGHYGTCMPDTCSSGDIDAMLYAATNVVFNGSAPVQLYSECIEDKEVGTDAMVVICFLAVLGTLVVLGTAYDVIAVQLVSNNDVTVPASPSPKVEATAPGVATLSRQKDEVMVGGYDSPGKMLGVSNSYTNGGFTDSDIVKDGSKVWRKSNLENGLGEDDVSPADVDIEKMDKPLPTDKTEASEILKKPKQRSVLEQVLLAFSIYSNGVKILSTHQGAGSLGAINGIRFLSMAWVILGHTYTFAMNYDDNFLSHAGQKINQWTFMAVGYATVSVDSFFTISGILVAYLTLKELKKCGGAKGLNWFMFYFHRFWRLTPPYMLVLLVATVILPLVYNGPLWPVDGLAVMGNCRKWWWTNLLYVNNFVDANELCMGWSWYLANDMQFYILSPLILLPLFYNIFAGSVSCMIFLLATVITTALVNKEHEYPAQNLSPYAPTPKDLDYMNNVYLPCYTRMGPYIVGLFTGYLLYRCKCKCRIPKIVNLACWVVCIAVICVIVYAPFSYNDAHIFTTAESDVYNALHRTGWGVAVCWIVFACATGHGGWINQILSWAPFIPLGRLSYCAYLVHPLVMVMVYSAGRQFIYFTDLTSSYLFIGHMVMSYGVAFITSMFFESPMMGLEKAIFRKGKK